MWCREWEIPEPTFLMTKSELRKILHKWDSDSFTQKYPEIFDEVWKIEEVRNELLIIFAKLTCYKVFGNMRGAYTILQEFGVSILAIDNIVFSNDAAAGTSAHY